MSEEQAKYGWSSNFPNFSHTPARVIRGHLEEFVRDAGERQVHAWDESIPPLQREVDEVLAVNEDAATYSTILEYELPLESRRPDVVLLAKSAVIVLELKGKLLPSQADLDQASAYARDLRCYHRECEFRPVIPIVVPTQAKGYVGTQFGVRIAGPDAIDGLVDELEEDPNLLPLSREQFLAESAYRPLPSLVKAARELFHSGNLRTIRRARAATDPAVDEISRIIHEAAATRTRRLILLTGIPGSGKTLVGLRIVHAHFLDDLAVPRANGKPTAPAIFLSGNGPLVDVLQYELRGAGGAGRTFVRGVKDYVKTYSARPNLIPPEHVLVFDEAQRAFDAEMVRAKHAKTPGFTAGRSEPEHFVEFAERIPEWCVVIGLIGGGQEIHVGEEAGLIQWRHALERSNCGSIWIAHGAPGVSSCFEGSRVRFEENTRLNLDTEIRFHLAKDLHHFVDGLLTCSPPEENARIAERLEAEGYHLRITREFEIAKQYLRDRYREHPDARFGLVASSKDRDLVRFGIANDFQSTKIVNYGPWYGEDESDRRSCRHLDTAVTEFGAQGLELDAALLAWGTDFICMDKHWSNAKARGYKRGAYVRDPFQLRINAYRVLLTRGRDATLAYIPPLEELDETFHYLTVSGFRSL
jgi:hypothetical protein